MKKALFTIIELIVVIVVALIIISITMAAYQKIITGKQVDSSAASVGAKLMEARQMAIARKGREVGVRQFVAVLMPGPNVTIGNEKRYHSFRLAIVDYDGTDYTFNRWPDDSKWEFTEPGCSIMEADVDIGIYTGGAFEVTPTDDSLTVIDGVDLTGLGGGNPVDNIRAVIFSKSGRVRGGSTRYVTLGDAKYIGNWMVPNKDTRTENVSCANQISLVVNQFTGGVRYAGVQSYHIYAP